MLLAGFQICDEFLIFNEAHNLFVFLFDRRRLLLFLFRSRLLLYWLCTPTLRYSINPELLEPIAK
jgi:hypothetical protein